MKPAILLEICFVNSTVDVALYQQSFEKVCQAIAQVLAEHVSASLKPTSPSNDDIRKRAITIVKKAVRDGIFTSPHTDVEKYTDAQLLRYVTIYLERLNK